MADLLDRLGGNVSPNETDPQQKKIPVHQFFAALVALADRKLNRAQIETAFDIMTTGQQATDLSFIINTYTGITGTSAAVTSRRIKYLDRLHVIFMLSENNRFFSAFTKAEISTWLTEAASGTV